MSDTIELLAETADTVTLRRADFEALLEAKIDALGIATDARHRAYEARVGWETARASYYTGDEVERVLAGESPVRVFREKRGLSQRALAERADMGVSYLCEIEAGKKPGSADALRRLALALDVPMEHLLSS